jgi:manganese/zinc/iron transport system ATP- binding protein
VSADPAVAVEQLTVAYQRKPALFEVGWQLGPGRLAAIVGPNGAGKSTLVKACLGLVRPLAGRIALLGRPLHAVRGQIGYVPQRGSVDWEFPISALEVVAMGRYAMLGWCRPVTRAHREAARAALAEVGLAELADRQIAQLSGGQQQRVFLARALAQEAQLYFMDEPFQGVDAATEQAIVHVLRRLRAEGRTVVCVHHDLSTVPDYFDEVLLLNLRVVASGPVAQAFTIENLRLTYGARLGLLEQATGALARLPLAS